MTYVEWLTHLTVFFGGIWIGAVFGIWLYGRSMEKGRKHDEDENRNGAVGLAGNHRGRRDTTSEELASLVDGLHDLDGRESGLGKEAPTGKEDQSGTKNTAQEIHGARFEVKRKSGKLAGPGSLLP